MPPNSLIAQEEIFGPVLSVIRARDFGHAIELANGTSYALTGGVYSRSPDHLECARQEFRVGNLYLNRKITGAVVGRQPFGGFKLSGVGSKAGGPLPAPVPGAADDHREHVRRGFAPEGEADVAADWAGYKARSGPGEGAHRKAAKGRRGPQREPRGLPRGRENTKGRENAKRRVKQGSESWRPRLYHLPQPKGSGNYADQLARFPLIRPDGRPLPYPHTPPKTASLSGASISHIPFAALCDPFALFAVRSVPAAA